MDTLLFDLYRIIPYIGYIKIKFKTLPFILVGQLLVVVQSRLKEIQTLAHPELIPDPLCWKWRWLSQPSFDL